MSKKVVSEICFNWHVVNVPSVGEGPMIMRDAFTRYVLGEAVRTSRGDLKCMKIELNHNDGLHAEVTWEDGSVERQWNLNKIIEVDEE